MILDFLNDRFIVLWKIVLKLNRMLIMGRQNIVENV